MPLTRRGVLIGALVGGGLAAGYLLRPRSYPMPLEPGRDEIAFDAWIKIDTDGVVTVAVPQLEMGQGVTTLIPQIVATELGADWRQVAVEPAPVSAHYANIPLAATWSALWMPALPALGEEVDSIVTRRWAEAARFTATADGTSLDAYELPAREAAATVRAMLSMAAARRWDVGWEECRAEDGFIVHGTRREAFATLVEEAAAFDPPDPPPLLATPPAQDPSEHPPGSQATTPRLDLPAKVDGSFLFAGDVRLPDMVYAAIRHGPLGKAEVANYDSSSVKGTPGLLRLVRGKRWLAAVATDWWTAEQALAKLAPSFDVSRMPSTAGISAALDDALRQGESATIHEVGEPDAVLRRNFDLAARYEVAPALHATVETTTATARLADGKLELWLASQAPEAARQAAAGALGMELRDVVLYPMPAGGSFDRRLENDHAIEVALIAREAGRPVQLVWSRWQEHVAGLPRTPAAALMAARTGQDGRLLGWRARIAVPPTAHEFGRRLFGGLTQWDAREAVAGQVDRMAMAGAVPPYGIAHVKIEHAPAAIDLPTARLRGNAHSYTAFFTESFIDELAHQAQREPLAYRMALLGGDVRLAECLQRVAVLGDWDGGTANSGKGLACHTIGPRESGGRIAVIATAQRGERGVRVDRIAAVADIGRIVNVDIARQQIEGGLIFGLGLAVGSSTDYQKGLPSAGRLRDLALPTLADCPEIEVDFVPSQEQPADPGELGVAAVAPAVANALFSATGLRLRRLPLFSEGL